MSKYMIISVEEYDLGGQKHLDIMPFYLIINEVSRTSFTVLGDADGVTSFSTFSSYYLGQ